MEDIGFKIMIGAWIFVLFWVPFVIVSNRKVHPKALFILFFAEMWERFSYYGMRVLLTLYMVKELFAELGAAEADVQALGIYGSYTSMVYLTPVVGGIIADRIMGFRKAIIFGGVLMMLGHFALAMEGMIFPGNLNLFFLSLALIIVGNGLFKPNISSFLGTFYGQNDPRKDGAFTIFYMGVNIGALLSIVTCGYVGEEISWHYGFGLAGIGMALGILIFMILGPKIFGNKGINPNLDEIDEEESDSPAINPETIDHESGHAEQTAKKPFVKINTPELKRKQLWTVLGTIASVPLVASMLNISDILTWVMLFLSVGMLITLVIMAGMEEDRKVGQRLQVISVLFVFHALFWALFEQAGGSITLFTDRNVDRIVLGSEMPASQFQLFNSLFIMLLAPLFSWIWIKLNQRKLEPSTPMKFVLGLVQLAIGFGLVVIAANMFANENALIPMAFIVLMYFFHTTGELSISPVGLSMISKLSPKMKVGFVMGAWFLSIALANKMAGVIGLLTTGGEGGSGVELTAQGSLNLYSDTYLIWGVFVVLGAAALLFFLVPTLRKWMNGIH